MNLLYWKHTDRMTRMTGKYNSSFNDWELYRLNENGYRGYVDHFGWIVWNGQAWCGGCSWHIIFGSEYDNNKMTIEREYTLELNKRRSTDVEVVKKNIEDVVSRFGCKIVTPVQMNLL